MSNKSSPVAPQPDQVEQIADEIKKRFDFIVNKPNNIDKIVLCAFVPDVDEYHRIERISSDDNAERRVNPDLLRSTILAERDKYVLDPYSLQNTFITGSHTYAVCPYTNGFVVVFASATRDARLFADATRKHYFELEPLIQDLIDAL